MKLSYDGHGLNRADGPQAGERVITWQRTHASSGGGYVVSDAEARELGPLLAAAPDLLAMLEKALLRLDQEEDGDAWTIAAQMRQLIASAKGD
jgi:hypothetical protein